MEVKKLDGYEKERQLVIHNLMPLFCWSAAAGKVFSFMHCHSYRIIQVLLSACPTVLRICLIICFIYSPLVLPRIKDDSRIKVMYSCSVQHQVNSVVAQN